ncbi:MAG: IscS subfamily cysteine desulfurase, partial [Gammaproteobacteria bacterium]|nr:IscS subfamily cysteine desulfurase [Gammaproteobacteria bacterium]
SASAEPSYVLRALGRDDQSAQSSIRFSIGRFTTDADIERAIEVIQTQVRRIRAFAA